MAREVSLASPTGIAVQARVCIRRFDQLCALFEDEERQFVYEISHLQVCDCYGKFKIWAGNIGALQTISSASSLEYRLRNVPKVSKQVISLLEDLDEALEGVCEIASGERDNRVSSPEPFTDELLSDYGGPDETKTAVNPSEPAAAQTSEIQELFQSIPETIASLFKLSILIRNSSSRDRYAKALAAAAKAPFEDQFDVDHVGNKFPRLYRDEMAWLRTRLGTAITQRRQYLRYCREHHEKLSKVPDLWDITEPISEPKTSTTFLAVQGQQSQPVEDNQTVISKPTSTLAPTTASTVVPAKLESSENLERLEEQDEDDNRSQTSYATSVGEDESDNKLSVVHLDEVATTGQSFECPYCWTIQRFNNQHTWRQVIVSTSFYKHVMRDLKPYVCTSEICDMKLFPDRHTWFTHELHNHLVEWRCCFCSRAPYQNVQKFQHHVRENHRNSFAESQLSDLVKVCQQPLVRLLPSACPFCDDEWEVKLRELNKHISADESLVVTQQQFRSHVSSHMEQLALFAIPRGYQEDGDGGSSGAAAPGSDASSDRSTVRPDYDDEENPRLHVAAFEGLLDEVKDLLDDESLGTNGARFEEGSTWGSALSAAAAGGHIEIADLCLPRTRSTAHSDRDRIPWTIDLPRSKEKGWGPLHWAASNGHLDMTNFLLDHGVSEFAKAHDGSTPADIARSRGYIEILQVLEALEGRADVRKGLGGPKQEQTGNAIGKNLRITVVAGDGLYKRDVFSLPDPFAVVTVDGMQTITTTIIKRTLNPYWSESVDVRATMDSVIAVQLFDQKRFEKKDQGFLGVVNFRVGDIIDLGSIGQERFTRDLKNLSSSNTVKGKLIMELSTKLDIPIPSVRYPLVEDPPTSSSTLPASPIYNENTTSNYVYENDLEDEQKGLPALWEVRENVAGRRYYVDHNTRSTTWVRPGKALHTTSPRPALSSITSSGTGLGLDGPEALSRAEQEDRDLAYALQLQEEEEEEERRRRAASP